ncbi:hypothetical protein I4U23_013313 [Adineta vaga]|nr:hypothetical protein I4U23_013313 [Adineta vaga]
MFRSKTKQPEVPKIINRSVVLCEVYPTDALVSNEFHILPVLGVLKRHKFEIKPVVTRSLIHYFCELRENVEPWSSELLEQAMREALPPDVRHANRPPVYWNFA